MSPEMDLQWNPQVSCRTLQDTAFILFGGRMISLNEVGSRVWDLFEQRRSAQDVADIIFEEFETTEQQALADVQAFVTELLQRDMLLPVQASIEDTGDKR